MNVYVLLILFFCLSCSHFSPFPAREKRIKKEADVPSYRLPNALISESGIAIETIEQWENLRKPELIWLFEEYVYGRVPEQISMTSFKVLEQSDTLFNNTATRKQVLVTVKKDAKELHFELLIYIPNTA